MERAAFSRMAASIRAGDDEAAERAAAIGRVLHMLEWAPRGTRESREVAA